MWDGSSRLRERGKRAQYRPGSGHRVKSGESEIFREIFGFGRPGAFGLEITPECSSAFLIAPIAIVAGALASRPRLPLTRILGAFLVAAGLLAIGNQVRVGLIAWLIETFGLRESYRWGHTIIGSLVSILFVAGALCVFAWIVVRGRDADADRGARA
jgi:exosortase/archaeosortase family protein